MKYTGRFATGAVILGVAALTAGIIAIPGPSGTHCTYNGALPDAHCTPGATNPAVTQATIGQTICVRGWTATVRPPVSVTQPIKAQVEGWYGVPPPHPKPFSQEELDHLIPLELGGATQDERNLWPEPAPGYHSKDATENQLRTAVCNGSLSLADAQRQIATDWTRNTATGGTTTNPDA